VPHSQLDKITSVFDSFKRDVLTFNVRLAGKDAKMYLLDELLYDDYDLIDYQKLGWRLRKLPAVLTFYISMKKAAERTLSDRKEAFDAWYAGVAAEENAKNVETQLAAPGPASMKKPLTGDQIKGLVMTAHSQEWEFQRAAVRSAQEEVDMLSALYEGLKAAIDLVRSEEKLVNTLLNQGLEQVRSNPQSRFNK
jgi:hypothetical protein